MEQIYAIPVNEAFRKGADSNDAGCPFCEIYRKLEDNELDLILGASMMEPDTRIKTNKEGFCRTHYDMMFVRKNRLGMALTLESHLDELREDMRDSLMGKVAGRRGDKAVKRISALEKTCYVCDRIEYHFEHMIETSVLLWESQEDFPSLVKSQPYYCLPHYRRMVEYAMARLQKKKYGDFEADVSEPEYKYFDKLRDDISWFCKKFDYRYEEEPWYDSKDAIERAMKFLRSDIHKN
ncbi:MAG: DUF6062 family protein [Clostridia bacterium]|nr:DUF6062 family protein [Clostridia bacterium]